MDSDSDHLLTHAHHVNLDDICSNLRGARVYTAAYFEAEALNRAKVTELVQAVAKAHEYLEVHMETLRAYKLVDSFYGLALRSQVYRITRRIPASQRSKAWKLWQLTDFEYLRNMYNFKETLRIPGDLGYAPDDDSSVGEADLRPFCVTFVPPPIKPSATPSPSKTVDGTAPSTSAKKGPKPKMIRTPQAPKEPSFASPSKQVAVVLPPKSAGSSPPLTRKHQRVQNSEKLVPAPKPTRKAPSAKSVAPKRAASTRAAASAKATVSKAAATQKKASGPSKAKRVTKKPVLIDPSSDSEAESESGDGEEDEEDQEEGTVETQEDGGMLSEEIEAPPVKRLRLEFADGAGPPPPPPSDPAPPLPPTETSSKSKGKQKATAPASPSKRSNSLHSLGDTEDLVAVEGHDAEALSPAEADNVDNTFYARAFHPEISLQYHEPPSRQALENLKLSMLPPAPASLTRDSTQIRNGRGYIFRAHSDLDPHFIRPPQLIWPCTNCSMAGYPEQCEFEGEVGEELCTKCKVARHGRCSARYSAHQLRRVATLLSPISGCSDSTIRLNVDRVERIDDQIALLVKTINSLREDKVRVVQDIADGLDLLAAREGGKDLVDAYAEISDYLSYFKVEVGTYAEGAVSAGGASPSGS
ncbi:uncharacterized protein ARMOST_18802 [Armillaria ostoyae]|uniref:Uncharacterized protein n=1 Tax=Armillaria ostoyae TaxID=47428 RepID=A0A284S2U5_ARMOS|nr:uncharacterized protein ARMOST_18802 [Armillaria ostoyae]